MKLVRYIAQATGMGRREAAEEIRSGRVRVDGRVVTSVTHEISPGRDRVQLGERLVRNVPPLTLVMYKPRATVCSRSDPEGRTTVYDLLKPRHRRAATVGRLDFNTTGVLILTTDGELAHRLTLPRHGVERSYRVKLRGRVTDAVLEMWRRGVRVKGRPTRPAVVRRLRGGGGGSVVTVTLREGRNRQIHDMARATGLMVSKIHRSRFGPVTLGRLRPGTYRTLGRDEVARLRRLVGLPADQAGTVAR